MIKGDSHSQGVTLLGISDKDDERSGSEIMLSAWDDTVTFVMFVEFGLGGWDLVGVDTLGLSVP